jgi:hypothetical protein
MIAAPGCRLGPAAETSRLHIGAAPTIDPRPRLPTGRGAAGCSHHVFQNRPLPPDPSCFGCTHATYAGPAKEHLATWLCTPITHGCPMKPLLAGRPCRPHLQVPLSSARWRGARRASRWPRCGGSERLRKILARRHRRLGDRLPVLHAGGAMDRAASIWWGPHQVRSAVLAHRTFSAAPRRAGWSPAHRDFGKGIT